MRFGLLVEFIIGGDGIFDGERFSFRDSKLSTDDWQRYSSCGCSGGGGGGYVNILTPGGPIAEFRVLAA